MKLPELGENIEGGDVLRVMVKAGDAIKKDQPVLELETDKATIEVPSSADGVVKEIKVKARREGKGRPDDFHRRRKWRRVHRKRATEGTAAAPKQRRPAAARPRCRVPKAGPPGQEPPKAGEAQSRSRRDEPAKAHGCACASSGNAGPVAGWRCGIDSRSARPRGDSRASWASTFRRFKAPALVAAFRWTT